MAHRCLVGRFAFCCTSRIGHASPTTLAEPIRGRRIALWWRALSRARFPATPGLPGRRPRDRLPGGRNGGPAAIFRRRAGSIASSGATNQQTRAFPSRTKIAARPPSSACASARRVRPPGSRSEGRPCRPGKVPGSKAPRTSAMTIMSDSEPEHEVSPTAHLLDDLDY